MNKNDPKHKLTISQQNEVIKMLMTGIRYKDVKKYLLDEYEITLSDHSLYCYKHHKRYNKRRLEIAERIDNEKLLLPLGSKAKRNTCRENTIKMIDKIIDSIINNKMVNANVRREYVVNLKKQLEKKGLAKYNQNKVLTNVIENSNSADKRLIIPLLELKRKYINDSQKEMEDETANPEYLMNTGKINFIEDCHNYLEDSEYAKEI